jgi:hypothetical protein
MTGVALGRQDEKFAFYLSSMTGSTVQPTVCAYKRKGGLLMNALHIKDLPSFRCMTAVARVSQPALVDIQVTINAGRGCCFKITHVVTKRTRYQTMMTDQGKISVAVIEFYRLPFVFVMAFPTGLLHALVWHGLRPDDLSSRQQKKREKAFNQNHADGSCSMMS